MEAEKCPRRTEPQREQHMFMNLLRFPLLYFGAISLAGFLAISCSGERSSATYARQPGEAPRPVIVELFTSEGCSSCPPADALLKKLSEQQPLQGVQIIALEEHVDYWNHLGWADPFSSDDFSQRQNAYAQIFGRDGVYTPQMVVDGQTEFVGSHSAAARNAILKAAAQPKLNVVLGFNASATPDKSSLDVRISNPQGISIHGPADLWLAVTESNLQSNVKAGENSGELLKHAAVVRSLRKISAIKDPASYQGNIQLTPESNWKTENLSAVVFVAEKDSRKIIGVGTAVVHP
jgi:hypothetical protein